MMVLFLTNVFYFSSWPWFIFVQQQLQRCWSAPESLRLMIRILDLNQDSQVQGLNLLLSTMSSGRLRQSPEVSRLAWVTAKTPKTAEDSMSRVSVTDSRRLTHFRKRLGKTQDHKVNRLYGMIFARQRWAEATLVGPNRFSVWPNRPGFLHKKLFNSLLCWIRATNISCSKDKSIIWSLRSLQ